MRRTEGAIHGDGAGNRPALTVDGGESGGAEVTIGITFRAELNRRAACGLGEIAGACRARIRPERGAESARSKRGRGKPDTRRA